jgi:hypothetical protein
VTLPCRRRFLSLLVVLAALVCSYLGVERRTPYTETDLQNAVPMGIPAVRTWADAPLSVSGGTAGSSFGLPIVLVIGG